MSRNFNPRSPHGERRKGQENDRRTTDFNPRSPHGERPTKKNSDARERRISIHAPRTGSDAGHARQNGGTKVFQSTLPARGATRSRRKSTSRPRFQSTLPARGATTTTGRDNHDHGFQSTLPARGATKPRPRDAARTAISIHAPRTGSDLLLARIARHKFNFNPRSPHGERRVKVFTTESTHNFNPRSPHGERQPQNQAAGLRLGNFNPRSPHGERRRSSPSSR